MREARLYRHALAGLAAACASLKVLGWFGNGHFMRMLTVSCLAVVMALVHGPSTAITAADLSELAGTFWRLDHLDGTSNDTSSIVVHISKYVINVSAPCVARLYPVSYASGSLKIEPSAGSTSCQGTKSSAMEAVETSLPKIAGYVVKADVLSFLDDQSHPMLTLSRVTATGLENKEWSIDQYYDGVNLVPATPEARVTFVNNFIDGSPGCGALLGNYILSGTRLKASVGWLLGGYCPGEFKPQNSGIVRALSGERTVERDDQRMVLRDAQETVQVILRP
jgi:heat shock protein HslJ